MSQKYSNRLLAGFSAIAMASALAPTANALVVRDDVTVEGSEEAADNPIYDGIIQIYMFQPGGAVSFNCTGQLINHRTVLSAAHCFNDLPSTAYGTDRANGDWTPIIAYGPDTFDSLFPWLFDIDADGDGFADRALTQVEIDERNGLTFATQVFLHPDGDTALGGLPFPGADVAMLALQDPLDNLPSYSVLLSPVGVGEHTVMAGYGGHGTGSTGDVDIDGKRQVGENILGMIGSQNDFLRGAFATPTQLFGTTDGEQVLYFTDFDRPDRDTGECVREVFIGTAPDLFCDPGPFSPFTTLDGNAFLSVNDSIDYFPGDATPGEAGTAGGDSGSGLFFDEIVEGELVVGGVLSGGFSITSPAPSGYGDVSYYNPLFLFHQFIAEQNPYKYVTAASGDGLWSDTTRWTQTLNPEYLIIDADGNVINGLPEGDELGVLRGKEFREGVVFDTDILDPTLDPFAPSGAGGAAADAADAVGVIAASDTKADGLVGASITSAGDSVFGSDAAVTGNEASSTLAGITLIDTTAGSLVPGQEDVDEDPELDTVCCGDVAAPGNATGPGSTGFVPTNNDGFGTDTAAYFDVTLSSSGVTTVDMDVEIDRLTLDNTSAGLVIGEDWIFESIIDTQIAAGMLDVRGGFISRDILNGGMITSTNGMGFIETDSLFNAGIISAGTTSGIEGVIGLGIEGDLILTSAGAILYQGAAIGVDGDVSLDGSVVFTEDPAFGETGTLLFASGSMIGELADGLVGVRSIEYTQTATSISLDGQMVNVTALDFEVTADTYANFLAGRSLDANTGGIAALLDGERSNYASLSSVYDVVDFLAADDAAAAISGLVPENTFSTTGLGLLGSASLPTHLERRFASIRAGTSAGTSVNNTVSSFQVAALDDRSIVGLLDQADVGGSSATESGGAPISSDSKTGAFIEVSYSSGDADSGINNPDGDISTTSVTAGIDREFSPGMTAGVYGHYTAGDTELSTGFGATDTESFGLGGYGVAEVSSYLISGYAGIAARDVNTARRAGFDLVSGGTDAEELLVGVSVMRPMEVGEMARPVTLTPELRFDYTDISIDGYSETGSQAALTLSDRDVTSALIKVGADAHFYDLDGMGWLSFKPSLGARLVYDLDGSVDRVNANFVLAPTTTTTLVGAERDKEWAELRAALNFNSADADVAAALFAEGTVGRDDLSYVTFGVNLKAKF